MQTCEPTQHSMPDEGGMPASRTVWYKFLVPETASYTFRMNSSAFGSILSAYRMTLNVCNGNVANVPFRIIENSTYNLDLQSGMASRISFKGIEGEVIYIAVDTNNPNVAGAFEILWSKTQFLYYTSLDYKNSGADLTVNRKGSTNITRWSARYGSTQGFNRLGSVPFGVNFDLSFYADFDGDGVSDNVAVRKVSGRLVWYIASQQGQLIQIRQFGLADDKPMVGDFDRDGMADITVYRETVGQPTTWHVLRSSDDVYTAFEFGANGDRGFVGDYDGDGFSDAVMIRSSDTGDTTWYIRRSVTGQVISLPFGKSVDIPQAADFDGDGVTDVAVFRRGGDMHEWSGYWFWIPSQSNLPTADSPITFKQFGDGFDTPQAADYDGDRKTDIAIYRGGKWWIESTRHFGAVFVHSFGAIGDTPATDMGLPFGGNPF